jgi:hypothetical protein
MREPRRIQEIIFIIAQLKIRENINYRKCGNVLSFKMWIALQKSLIKLQKSLIKLQKSLISCKNLSFKLQKKPL